MSETPSIEMYKKGIEEGHFRAYKCTSCGAVIAPPLGACYSCGGSKMDWTNVSGKGTLVSFTVIHVAPDEFVDEVPYIVAIVELEEKTRISARLLGFDPLKPEDIEVGIPVTMEYTKGASGRSYLAFRPL